MKQCHVYQAISGAGKTTHHKEHFPHARVYTTDNFFMKDGEYLFDSKKLGEAHDWNFRQFIIGCETGEPEIVVDNTNTSVWEIAPYIRVAEIHGYEVTIIRLLCAPEIAFERNAHNCPLDAIRGQHERLMAQKDLLPPWWKVDEIEL
jgi:hypothetical protein